jgi:hypothetical protein
VIPISCAVIKRNIRNTYPLRFVKSRLMYVISITIAFLLIWALNAAGFYMMSDIVSEYFHRVKI